MLRKTTLTKTKYKDLFPSQLTCLFCFIFYINSGRAVPNFCWTPRLVDKQSRCRHAVAALRLFQLYLISTTICYISWLWGQPSISGNFWSEPCSHGDFIGAILGTGITWGKVGDILLKVDYIPNYLFRNSLAISNHFQLTSFDMSLFSVRGKEVHRYLLIQNLLIIWLLLLKKWLNCLANVLLFCNISQFTRVPCVVITVMCFLFNLYGGNDLLCFSQSWP
jgi:hypothetical protein